MPTEMFAFDSGNVCTSFAKCLWFGRKVLVVWSQSVRTLLGKCLCFVGRVLALDSRWPKREGEGEVTRRTESFVVAQSGHVGGLVTRVVPKRERFVFE